MKKFLAIIGGLGALVGLVAAHPVFGPGTSSWGSMGPGMIGRWEGHPGQATTNTPEITEEKAKALAQNYADLYLTGFNVYWVLPFAGVHHTMYLVELENSEGELRTLHINSFGNVILYGGFWKRG